MNNVVAGFVVLCLFTLAAAYLLWARWSDRREMRPLSRRDLQLPPQWTAPEPDAAYKADLERDLS